MVSVRTSSSRWPLGQSRMAQNMRGQGGGAASYRFHMGRVLFPSLVLISMVAVSGCGSQATGVSIPLGSESLRACKVQRLHVEQLHTLGSPGCDLEGSSVIFPEGTALTIEAVGVNVGEQPDATADLELTMVNWGLPGVGAALVRNGRATDVWATSEEAMTLQRQQLHIDGRD